MPCSGLSISSPAITCLDFLVQWNISGATPQVTITNNSTVVDNTKLKWWFYITSPSGTAVYGVDLDTLTSYPTPDVTGVAWTTKTYDLQTPFGNPPCGQIEFSPNSPYTVEVFVQDITTPPGTLFSYSKTTIIVRPNGNTMNSCGNFGSGAVNMKVDCANRVIMCFDGTKTSYNSILDPTTTTNKWTIVYPEDPSGSIPNDSATNVPNVNFPISINSKNYSLYFTETATYDYSNGTSVVVQYKLFDKTGGLGLSFAINCNTNLCLIQCQMKKFYELSKSKCGTLENAELTGKMTRLNFLFSQILTGIFQPLCGIDVGALMDEMVKIGNFDANCDCGCGCNGDNLGFSNPTGTGGSSSGGCCPVYTNVLDTATNIAPANCPNGYFPASVYDPTKTTIIGVAYNSSDLVNIINANAAWQAYGTAFDAGNCKVGFFPLNSGVVIPNPYVTSISGGTGQGQVIVNVLNLGTGLPPATCPSSYFPAQVFDPTGVTIIGVANDVNELVGILNANGAWQAYGTAYVVDNCHVGWNPAPGIGTIPPVLVNVSTSISTGCVNGMQLYPVTITDICYPTGAPITAFSFPFNLTVDFGSGPEYVGTPTSQANMIALLNAHPTRPSAIAFSAGSTVDQVVVTNTDCASYSGTITLSGDNNSNKYLLFTPNHGNMDGSLVVCAQNAMSVQYLSNLGEFPGSAGDVRAWHSIKIGTTLLTTIPSVGQVFVYDISNPLMPTLTNVIVLNHVVLGCFGGLPTSANVSSPSPPVDTEYSLYFPTDYYAGMALNAVYVVEALTGSTWLLDITSSTITDSFQDDKLIGKCPRVLVNGLLYFTQDGDLEQATGQTSGILEGEIVVLDTSDFSGTGLSTRTVFVNQSEYAWAASYDGGSNIYFTGNKTSICKWDVPTDSSLAVYSFVAGAGSLMQYRANSSYFPPKLYITPQVLPGYTGMIVNTASIGSLPTQFTQPPGGDLGALFNFKPIGNCLGVMTSAKTPGGDVPYVSIHKLDGTFVSNIPLTTNEEFYNVVPIQGITVITPNNYV